MKKQTFIAFFEDMNGQQITFERFCCKRLSTVEMYIKELWSSPLYRKCNKGAEMVKIYATPDGVHKESEPCVYVNLQVYA